MPLDYTVIPEAQDRAALPSLGRKPAFYVMVHGETKVVGLLIHLTSTPEEGYAAFAPALPGCATQGRTESQAIEDLKSVFKDMIAVYGGVDSAPLVQYPEITTRASSSFRYVMVTSSPHTRG